MTNDTIRISLFSYHIGLPFFQNKMRLMYYRNEVALFCYKKRYLIFHAFFITFYMLLLNMMKYLTEAILEKMFFKKKMLFSLFPIDVQYEIINLIRKREKRKFLLHVHSIILSFVRELLLNVTANTEEKRAREQERTHICVCMYVHGPVARMRYRQVHPRLRLRK